MSDGNGERQAAKIRVPSDDPPGKKDDDKEPIKSAQMKVEDVVDDDKKGGDDDKKKKKKKKGEDDENELSAEDQELKDRLTLLVERICEEKVDEELQGQAMDQLKSAIRASTSSMTSIPKPLKFLRPHYERLCHTYEQCPRVGSKRQLADIMSVLAMTMAEEGSRASLRFRLSADKVELGSWGHEYVRHLQGEIGEEFAARQADAAAEARSKVEAAYEEKRKAKEAKKKKKKEDAAAAAAASGGGDTMEVDDEHDDEEEDGDDEEEDVEEAAARAGDEAAEAVPMDDLLSLVHEIVPFHFKHNAETDACDLLLEVGGVPDLLKHVTKESIPRVARYLLAVAEYLPKQDERAETLTVVFELLDRGDNLTTALCVALKMQDSDKRRECILRLFKDSCERLGDELCDLTRKQLALLLGAHREVVADLAEDEYGGEEIYNLSVNADFHRHFAHLARELDVQEAKTVEEVYKDDSLSGPSGAAAAGADGAAASAGAASARQNLAATFVNALVNCGFRTDKLVLKPDSDWLYKNKDHGMLSAAASLGLLYLWSVEEGYSEIDKYSYSQQPYIKAGAALANGAISAGVGGDDDASLGLLGEHLELDGENKDALLQAAALQGLGIAYAGSATEEVLELATPLVMDGDGSLERCAMGCLAAGMTYVGTANEDVVDMLRDVVLDRSEDELRSILGRLIGLSLGLLFLGKGEAASATLAQLEEAEKGGGGGGDDDAKGENAMEVEGEEKAEPKPALALVRTTVLACAYFGTGHVVTVQTLLNMCALHIEEKEKEEEEKEAAEAEARAKEEADRKAQAEEDGVPYVPGGVDAQDGKKKDADEGKSAEAKLVKDTVKAREQQIAVIGIAMICMGEDLSSQMAHRAIDHVLQYGESNLRRAVPIALALLSISNPVMPVIDTLSKLSHDHDLETSQNACLALGFVGAGTNNSRVAKKLQELAKFYSKEAGHLFLVRIAQGILHLGKGLMTLDPFHSDRSLSSPAAVAGVLVSMFSMLDLKETFLSNRHSLIYSLTPAIRPRFFTTVDENMEPVAVKVRVGTAVDTVAQAGRPKRITGFQTHSTPVLLARGQRAELATDEYLAVSSILEGVVIVRKNPDYEE